MDESLSKRLSAIEKQIVKLKEVEETFFLLEGSEKPLFNEILLQSTAKTAWEKQAHAYTSAEYKNFMNALGQKKSEHNKEKRINDLLNKVFDAEYITYKNEASAIRRQA